ncbi:MAG TPA: recombination regulator RecX [Methylophilaceae bacterium]|nr:recombination regulator RecX [Methylophilaceae bacterium]
MSSKPTINLRERALGFLSRREYSYKELEQKLRGYAEEQDDVPALLEDFKKRGWLSEERYTEQIVHARKGKFGSLRVAHELREHGVAEELISKAVAEVKTDEVANARAIHRKKYKAPPANREEWAKQARFLQSRGFGFDVIKQVLRDDPDEDF